MDARLTRILRIAIAVGVLLLIFNFPRSVSATASSLSQTVDPLAKIDPRLLGPATAQDTITFWIVLKSKADLDSAVIPRDWNARGQFVYQQLRLQAATSQAGLQAWLNARGADTRPFWIVNAIRVSADGTTLLDAAARPEVARVVPDGGFWIPQPITGEPDSTGPKAIEWNLDRIRAPEVWSTFGVHGEGIVVANIDTGVQFDHPALVAQYRGNLGDGTFDHNYNWFDPSEICDSPSLAPCDNIGHGTHTMGTLVGDDGHPGANRIGVAPGARWIAAKGCESYYCSYEALLAAGQWILSPTDLNGNNPRPDLRPHIVNNSWGGSSGDTFYESVVQAWVAAGIFPVFAGGNDGPSCNTAGSPGDYVQSYSVGAFDSGNDVAYFSSRGAGLNGELKPNIAAPGAGVRSSVPNDDYHTYSGTSMAAPHVAGTVALIWSVAPSLVGDIDATRMLLDETAVDVSDLSCGGADSDNNVWGEGRLDALAAVDYAPRGPTGLLLGHIADNVTDLPIGNVRVQVEGPSDRLTSTDAAGDFHMRLSVGTYAVSASAFGYLGRAADGIVVSEGMTTTLDLALTTAPLHTVSGYVRDDGAQPVANANVTILSTPLPSTVTDSTGFYSFDSVPEGEYDVYAEGSRCSHPVTQHLAVDGDESLDVVLPARTDDFGYRCQLATADLVDAGTLLPLAGVDQWVKVNLPFAFPFYGEVYDSAYVSTNGYLNLSEPNSLYNNQSIPSASQPNAAIYPFWEDLNMDSASSARTELLGEAPHRRFVIEWRNVRLYCCLSKRVRFEVVLFESGDVVTQYADIMDDGLEQGNSATLGIENEAGNVAMLYAYNEPVVRDGLAIRYVPPPFGYAEGQIVRAIDGRPVAGATVNALEQGRSTTTDAQGHYLMLVPVGDFTLETSAHNYVTDQKKVTIADRQTATQDFALLSARAGFDSAALQFIAVAGVTRTQVLSLDNTGLVDLTFEIGEVQVFDAPAGGAAAATASDTRTAPKAYKPTPVAGVLNGGDALLFMDALPWGKHSLTEALDANGVSYDIAASSHMASLDLSMYKMIVLASDQPTLFYSRYAAYAARFEEYVANGGQLWVGAAAWGYNYGSFNGGRLPGGATVYGPLYERYNDVIDPGHPAMQGLPNPFGASYASHAAFIELPEGTRIIAQGEQSELPTLIEYDFGAGRVLAFGQTLEYNWGIGDPGRILENAVPYFDQLSPFEDLPWLTPSVMRGSLAPGASQRITVAVDTTGLQPGLYRSRLIFQTNDPDAPRLSVPVTLIVPAYRQGVNAGGRTYTDQAGDVWAVDQAWQAGSWGHVSDGWVQRTSRAIAGTDDGALYQDLRRGMYAYRFDGLPPGTYQVELRFAEVRRTPINRHLFDVIIEDVLALPMHDTAYEVGSFAADDAVFFVEVIDGALDIRFLPQPGKGQPFVNALRVTHRPDR